MGQELPKGRSWLPEPPSSQGKQLRPGHATGPRYAETTAITTQRVSPHVTHPRAGWPVAEGGRDGTITPGCRGDPQEHPQASTQRTGLGEQHPLEEAPDQPPSDATHRPRLSDQSPGGRSGRRGGGMPGHSRGSGVWGSVPAHSKLLGQIPAGPKPGGSGGSRAPQPLAAGSRTLPSSSSAPLRHPLKQRASPSAHSPRPPRAFPKARGSQSSLQPTALGLLQEPRVPPSPPWRERVPPWGSQGGKRSVTG